MRFAIVAWMCVTLAAPAHADEDDNTRIVDAALLRVREHFAKGELDAAKELLLATYAQTKRADLLFALGQVEYNLGHYKPAIEYYEQFLSTSPAADAAALAHQAIGSARAKLDAPIVTPPKPPPPTPLPPRRVRDWDGFDTALVLAGAAIAITGGALFTVGYRAGDDQSGTLAAYDRRLDRSLLRQRTGGALAGSGVVLVGIALLRWRVHRIEIAPTAAPTTIGLTAGGAW